MNIHIKLLKNLLIGGIGISILMSISIYLLEYHHIDDYVKELAYDESVKYSEFYNDYYNSPTEKHFSILSTVVENTLKHDLFITIELYDKQLKKIIGKSTVDNLELENKISNVFTQFAMTGKTEIIKEIIAGKQFIKVMSPIRSQTNNQVIAHFEGVFHINEQALEDIEHRIIISVLQSVAVILATTLLLYPIILHLNKRLNNLSQKLLLSNIDTIKSLGGAIAKRDSDTNAHNYRVTIYSVKIAEALNSSDQQIQSLIKGAFLHDIGKIGITDNILLKPGKLTENEFEIMKQHVKFGLDIVNHNDWLKDAIDVIYYHHEKYDGSGYTKALKGEEIPVNARIFAIADVFDALTSERPYKKPFSYEQSMQMLSEGSGKHFDPNIFDKFQQIAQNIYNEVSLLETDEALIQYLDKYIYQYFHISK